jgi:C-terminal processing protease CtpA/Prc
MSARPTILALCATGVLLCPPLAAQQPERIDPELGRIMLQTIQRNLRSHYYDTAFHQVKLDSVFQSAEQRIQGAQTNTQIFAIIAMAVFALDDSHTSFWPPERAAEVRYGWQIGMVGDSCYIVAVAPGSDAERQGVKVGDLVLAVDRYAVTRDNAWKLQYVLGSLDPRATVTLVLRSPGDTVRQIRVASRVIPHKRLVNLTGTDDGMDIWELVRQSENWDRRHRDEFVSADSILIWRMPTFLVDEDRIDAGVDRARRHRALILDLRGNGGGYESALLRLLGRMFPKDVPVGTAQRRRGIDSLVAKGRGDRFQGELTVLVDSRSASASEIFAATVQVAKRGTVIGDRSAGAVMESRCYGLSAGSVFALLYGLCATSADLILSDGTRLEKRGVIPDETVLPGGSDLASGRDPVLARALERLGHRIDPGEAGRLLTRRSYDLLW